MAPQIKLTTVGSVVLALVLGALLFLETGEFFKELKAIGYGLLWLVVFIVVVVLIIEYDKSRRH